MSATIETVTFKLNAGTDADAFANAAEAANTWITRQPGFRNRTLSVTAEGLWIEHIEWASLTDAQTAAQKIGGAVEMQPFVSAIDGSSVAMHHSTARVHA